MASRRTPDSKSRTKPVVAEPVTVPVTPATGESSKSAASKAAASKTKAAGKATSKSAPQSATQPATQPSASTPAATPVSATEASGTKRPAVTKSKAAAVSRPVMTPDMRRGMIAKAAYLRAERRGFAPGHEDEDWLAAEAEVDQLLSADHRAPQ